MPQEYDNEMRGVLFPNDKQGNDKRPDMTGNVTIGGITYRLAAWVKTTKRGRILSLAVSEQQQQTAAVTTDTVPDDDLPF